MRLPANTAYSAKNKTERECQHRAGFCTHKATSKAGYRSIKALHYEGGLSHQKYDDNGYGVFPPPQVHAQREYRCPKGNIVFAKGKNIVQAAGLNIVTLAAALPPSIADRDLIPFSETQRAAAAPDSPNCTLT
ncbi:MAG: hypothetical protein J6Q98_03110 [Bacteroidaceae bacterium]|nr:hypothetical protein [Bacteroidaceae bacterium]